MQSFTQLLQRLADAGIEFVIVGGYAAVAHGSTIVTRDLDICALLTPESVAVLRRALAEFHPRHRLTPHRLSFLDFPKGAARGYSLFVGRYSGAAERRYSLFVNRYSGGAATRRYSLFVNRYLGGRWAASRRYSLSVIRAAKRTDNQ